MTYTLSPKTNAILIKITALCPIQTHLIVVVLLDTARVPENTKQDYKITAGNKYRREKRPVPFACGKNELNLRQITQSRKEK